MAIIAKQGIAGHVREALRQDYPDYCRDACPLFEREFPTA
jgi:hypothetical protein